MPRTLKYESICKPNKQISVFTELVNTASFKGKSAASAHERSDGQTIEDYLVEACHLLGNDKDKDIENEIQIKQRGFEVYSQYTIRLARYLVDLYGPYNNGGRFIGPLESDYRGDITVAPDLLLKQRTWRSTQSQGAIIEIKTTFRENNTPTGLDFLQCLDQFLTFKKSKNTYNLGLLVYITAEHGKPFHTTIYEFNENRAKIVIECILYARAYNALTYRHSFTVKKPEELKRLVQNNAIQKIKEGFEQKSNKINKAVLNKRVNIRLEIPFQNWWMRIRRELEKFDKYFKIGNKVRVKYPDRYYDGEITEATSSFVKILFTDDTYTTLEESQYDLIEKIT